MSDGTGRTNTGLLYSVTWITFIVKGQTVKMHLTAEWLKNKIETTDEECCEVGLSNLNSLLSADEFRRMYVGEWKPDPLLNECVEYLRYATPKEISERKREGIFTAEMIREAKQILRKEKGK